MKIAIAQINVAVGQPTTNRDKIIEQISIAAGKEADILIFGEMTITGTPLYDLPQSENFMDKVLFELSEIAEYTKDIDVLIGAPMMIEDEIFNSVIHISRGEIAAEFCKAMVLSRDEIGYISGAESECFEADEPLENIISVNGEKMLVAIGDDIDFIEELECLSPRSRQNIKGVIHMEAARYYHGVAFDRVAARQKTAIVIKKPIISVNNVGGAADIVYYGASIVVNSRGELVMQLPAFEEKLDYIDLEEVTTLKQIRNKKLTKEEKTNEIFKALTLCVKDYFGKRGFKKAALGLSGGIDSAIVLAVAVEALGAENVDVLIMPSEFSSKHSVTDATKMANNLNVKYHIVNIAQSYDAMLGAMSPLFGNQPFSVAEENMQSRIRGTILMAYSNKFGHIVLNTSNKCEVAMGYGTLYGDTNGALSILGDLYKKEIYDIAHFLNKEREIIPQNIIDKAPSAELRPNQKDTDSLPDYDVLDTILYKMIEGCETSEEIIKEGFERSVVEKVATLLKNNEYKRRQLPPIVRLSTITLNSSRVVII